MNNTKKSYIKVGIVFLVSIITGIISSYFVAKSDALIIGVSSFFILSLIEIQLNQQKQNNSFSKITFILTSLINKGSYQELIIKRLIKSYDSISKDGLWADSDNYWDLWIDSIETAKKSWIVVNYAKIENVWKLGFADKVVSIQKEKIANGSLIERIFIFESNEEKELANDFLINQAMTGTKVKWLLKKDIPDNDSVKKLRKKVETIDFGIIDDSWVFRAFLDSKRKVKKVNSIQDDILLEYGKTLVNEIRKVAIEITPANKQ